MSEWISVNDRLTDEEGVYLCNFSDNEIYRGISRGNYCH